MIITTFVEPPTSIDAKLRELYLVRQDDDDDAGCPFCSSIDIYNLDTSCVVCLRLGACAVMRFSHKFGARV
jgi:hypothetical protein